MSYPDLIQRLRNLDADYGAVIEAAADRWTRDTLTEAADELERIRDNVEEYREWELDAEGRADLAREAQRRAEQEARTYRAALEGLLEGGRLRNDATAAKEIVKLLAAVRAEVPA
jgi:hypothetical protein